MVQNLQMAWVVVATCEVHYEAVKSQNGGGVPVYSRQLWKVRSRVRPGSG